MNIQSQDNELHMKSISSNREIAPQNQLDFVQNKAGIFAFGVTSPVSP